MRSSTLGPGAWCGAGSYTLRGCEDGLVYAGGTTGVVRGRGQQWAMWKQMRVSNSCCRLLGTGGSGVLVSGPQAVPWVRKLSGWLPPLAARALATARWTRNSPLGPAPGKDPAWFRSPGFSGGGRGPGQDEQQRNSRGCSPNISDLGARMVCSSHQGLHPW